MIRGEGKVDIRLSEPYILIKMENKSNLSFSTPHLPLKKKRLFFSVPTYVKEAVTIPFSVLQANVKLNGVCMCV